MVEARLNLEYEVQQIFQSIDEGRNFLLSGGAGSGKTYSLVSVIRQVIAENPTAKVACMTYTNAAVKEIEERVNHKNLNVSTIHDFLWDSIKHFQKELKEAIISLANNDDVSIISIDETNPIPENYFEILPDGIQYKEFVRLREGIISHDELLTVANYLFEKYPKLSSIVKDKYKFIFIDEYQDTSKTVVDIFLTHFKQSERKNIIGFFGDAMQSIYEDGIGNLDGYTGNDIDKVNEIQKKQNRRNPQLVIDLANKLRSDGIIQERSNDPKAPNMLEGVIKQGTVFFLHSTDDNISNVEEFLKGNYNWNFNNSKETKQLNLTHNLIADKAGFRTLMDIYDNDPILGLKAEILEKIKYNKKNDRPEIEIYEDDTFDGVVDRFQLRNRQRELKKDLLLADPVKAELYNQLKDKPFSEIRKMYLSKDALIDDKKQNENDENKKGSKRDNLIKHLFKIQTSIVFYKNGRYNEFLRATDFRFMVTSIAKKRELKEHIVSLINTGDKSIEQVISEADELGICVIDDKLIDFKEKKGYLYNRVKDVKFSEFQKLYEYLEGQTPFSTQHKTKGAEFNNVLVILDNGGWNNYNFKNLFLETGTATVLDRTQKIFYVCCTRAKENLAVFFHNPGADVIAKAKLWFGDSNVISI
ncbi:MULTISPECIES: UvrD-helicase domain-containing protein [Chryseobacterium]|uniref:DNA helicase-2/ATP-dependent DNA helicase PcrA n=1 Tax=Chryseobacterium geocarposphaerae TaxID=1416776 RepID=A0ABU1LB26_9FLAO|nr:MULTISPECIES: UvrD-helicase domain-containing protein [Chryseobacterium]MDR6403927.1 DNA helicase-2/ATP-dependent DNA helicase PcrA [Chryseobacterium geocarposphaerae]MDR6698554.1 DNA helicase-2/ATP-dependent DNA helicase PcrA [Chryseobacterium ginsenosidimutans]